MTLCAADLLGPRPRLNLEIDYLLAASDAAGSATGRHSLCIFPSIVYNDGHHGRASITGDAAPSASTLRPPRLLLRPLLASTPGNTDTLLSSVGVVVLAQEVPGKLGRARGGVRLRQDDLDNNCVNPARHRSPPIFSLAGTQMRGAVSGRVPDPDHTHATHKGGEMFGAYFLY